MSTMPQKIAPRIQDLNKFTLYTNVPGVENQRAKLVWSIRGDNPRITVFYFNPNINKNDIISISLTPDVFLHFCEQLENIASASPGTKNKIEFLVAVRDTAGKMTGEKKLISELWYGVDAEGLVWISVAEGDKPKIKFNFGLWEYYKIYKSDGAQLSATEASVQFAKITAKALRDVYTIHFASFGNIGNKQNVGPGANALPATDTTYTKADSEVLEDINF